MKISWQSLVIGFRTAGAVAGFILLVVGSVVAVVDLEPLSIIAASGVWLYVAREGYLVLFSIAFAIVTTSASPLPARATTSAGEYAYGADRCCPNRCRAEYGLADRHAAALIAAIREGLRITERMAEG